ncbi:PRC-barrel domain-containing protein [Vineibacter terrae]|uniref:PRC-barrel domain-containing protein n=1 Tax=Vineibacter terrae TaxID=2586908 RepID=UPI002E354B53|nr:PRC-barrel domain-containing protein [Vineibacter terrae]HEX2891851.1 PRC-barrel domain-containing protein [Vineibacter terrae]
MKMPRMLAAAALGGAFMILASGALGQGQPQTVELTKVDVVKVSTGYRATKVVGASVTNSSNDSIGKIDDVIISSDGKAPYAILSVGGFLGMGTRLIAIPYESLRFADSKIMLPGATKDSLKALPEFKYAKE